MPFGVLTRTEQTFLTGSSASPRRGPGTTAWALILTTLPVLNHADPGLYGGCMQRARSPGDAAGLPAAVDLGAAWLPAQPGA